MDADREIELKLAVPDGAWAKLQQAVVRAGARREGKPKSLQSVYFDTDDKTLRQRGFVLRIRSDGEKSIQTIKSIGPLHCAWGRGEWETAVQGSRPVLDRSDRSPLARQLRPKLLEKLRPAFTVDVEREIFVLDRGKDMIEIALDRGVVRHGDRQQPFAEVELELRQGVPQALLALAREIGASVPVLVSLTTKAERGHRLGAEASGQPVARIDYALRPDMDAPELARAILHPCLAALLENLAMLMAGRGSEALHQSRVCVRRLRASLSLLRSSFGWEAETALRGELKWLADLLGGAREYDVFIKAALAPAAEANPDVPGFEALLEAFQQRRERAYDAVIAAIGSPRMLTLSLELLGCFKDECASQHASSEGKDAAWRCMEKELRRRLKSLLRDGGSLGKLSAAEQHQIRIRAKKLRYMLEPFAGFVPQKRFRSIIGSLQAMQDALGDINDDGVNRGLALAYARDAPADRDAAQASFFAAGIVAAACRPSRQDGLRKAIAALEKLARAPEFEFRL